MESPTGGVDHPLSNDDIVNKFLGLTRAVASETRVQQILTTVLNLDSHQSADDLRKLLIDPVTNPLA